MTSPLLRVGLALVLALGASGASGQQGAQNGAPETDALLQAELDERGLSDRAKIEERLAALRAELAAIPETDPNKDSKTRVVNLEVQILTEQAQLLVDQQAHEVLGEAASAEGLAQMEARRDEKRRELADLDVDAALAPLRGMATVDDLRREIGSAVTRPFETANEARRETERQLEQARERLRELPRNLSDLRTRQEALQTELDQLQTRLTPGLAPEEASLVQRRIDARRMGLLVLRAKNAFLSSQEAFLDSLAKLRALEHDVAQAEFDLRQRIQTQAQALLQQRTEAAQQAAQAELERAQQELARAREGYERLFREQELEARTLETTTAALRQELQAAAQRRTQLVTELHDGDEELSRLQDRYAPDSSYDGEADVLSELQRLQSQVNRARQRNERADIEERMRSIRDARRAAEANYDNLDERFDTLLTSANEAFEAELARGAAMGEWSVEEQRWRALREERRGLRDDERAVLGELAQELTALRAVHQDVFDRRREALVLLQRSNLFMRGRSSISWSAIRQGLQDVTRLPAQVPRFARSAAAYVETSGAIRALVTCAALLVLALGAVFLIERRVRRRLRALRVPDTSQLSHRVALTTTYLLRGALRAGFLFLAFYLPAKLLPELPTGVEPLMAGLGITLSVLWFARRLNRELFWPRRREARLLPFEERSARRVYVAFELLIFLSFLYWPLHLSLLHLGYANQGAMELLAMAYRVVVGVVILTVLGPRSVFMGLLPGPATRTGRLLRLVLSFLHPFVVLLVPGLVILDALQYDILAQLITGVSVVLVAVSLAAYLVYHGALFLLERVVDTARKDGESDEDALRRDRNEELFTSLRFLLRLGILLGAGGAALGLNGSTLADVEYFFAVPLPMQNPAEGARPVTLWDLAIAMVFIVLTVQLTKRVKGLLQVLVLPRTSFDAGLQYTITTLTGYLVLALGISIALSQLFELEKLGYVVAALSIGIGFGLQEIISNFISGLILLFERPLRVGDMIQVGNTEGIVRRIQIRSTTVQTRDNVWILVPNKDFITQNVTNYIYTDPKFRLHVKVGVAYGSDTALVRKVLMEVAQGHGKVLKRPGPEVWFLNFGDSSLDFELLVWIDDPVDHRRIASSLRFAIDAAFRRNSIQIPFPQRDLHLRSADAPLLFARARGAAAEEGDGDEEEPSDAPRLPG